MAQSIKQMWVFGVFERIKNGGVMVDGVEVYFWFLGYKSTLPTIS
jgi:hypothetical protein